jgi:repressor LexA
MDAARSLIQCSADRRAAHESGEVLKDVTRPAGESVKAESPEQPKGEFTALQGQYLAFIHLYSLIHRRAPAEAEIQQFFRVTPPTVHQMILTLEGRGLLGRTPGAARSLRVLVRPAKLPQLVDPTSRESA